MPTTASRLGADDLAKVRVTVRVRVRVRVSARVSARSGLEQVLRAPPRGKGCIGGEVVAVFRNNTAEAIRISHEVRVRVRVRI